MTCAQLADEVAGIQGDRRTPLGVGGLPSAPRPDVVLPASVQLPAPQQFCCVLILVWWLTMRVPGFIGR
jgi:hypothetical protein